jgi:hypothetical protein
MNMSITRFNYLFWRTNRGRYLQYLVLEIGERSLFCNEGSGISLQSGGACHGYVCEIPYWNLLNVIICPRENYVVTNHKRFVYFNRGVAELKLERPGVPFGLASKFVLLKVNFCPLGTVRFTFRPIRLFQRLER